MSSSLDALVRDSIRESSPSSVDWEDVNSSVFLRFVQFAYTGNYSSEMPTEPDAVSPRPLKEYSSDAFALPYSLTSYNSAARNWRGMFDTCPHEGGGVARRFDYTRCDCGPSEATKHYISTFLSQYCRSVDISPNIARHQGTGSVEHLICHIQMWTIANKYAVDSLMDKALSELALGLADWLISAFAFVPQFEKLINYIYTVTSGPCQLRDVVASFATCVSTDASTLGGWETLLENTPDFTMDLVRQMTKRHSINHLTKPKHHTLFRTT
ncbi:hypothetical protein F5Y08DRAFT_322833 [Xylaria arbuscula]|nr:hypothetical protein F5Y08DRAFT_322833 [Xylaria arbuscula]